MFYRSVCLFLAGLLILIALPFGNSATPAGAAKANAGAATAPAPQDLQMQQTQTTSMGGTTTYRMTGQFRTTQGIVKLRAVTVKSPNFNFTTDLPPVLNGTSSAPNSSVGPGATNNSAPSADNEVAPEQPVEHEPSGDFYYSQAEMSRSDGTPILETTYEYAEYANRSMFYATFGGVTQTFDLNTGEVSPMTEENAAQLDAWMVSDDGTMAQDTSVAIVQQGAGQASEDLLLNYYLISILIDRNPTSESASKGKGGGGDPSTLAGRLQLVRESRAGAESAKTCYLPANPLVAGTGFSRATVAGIPNLALAGMRSVQCFGCCGPGCWCIPDRCGRPIWGPPCAAHDDCARRTGRWLGPCRGSFARAAAYVIFAHFTCMR